jgi:hypothetical protein
VEYKVNFLNIGLQINKLSFRNTVGSDLPFYASSMGSPFKTNGEPSPFILQQASHVTDDMISNYPAANSYNMLP